VAAVVLYSLADVVLYSCILWTYVYEKLTPAFYLYAYRNLQKQSSQLETMFTGSNQEQVHIIKLLNL
jgi:hypothetical protein